MQDDTLVMVLAGGAGERLYPLTKERAKPAVYFGGPYRIIDFTLSNCINSGLRRIFIALQYKSLSLSRHIRMGWSVVADELGEFIEILQPAEAGRRALVPRHRRRGLPEPLLDPARRAAPPDRAVRRPRLQDGLRARCCASIASAARRDDRRARRCRPRRPAASASSQVDDEDRLTGFLEKPQHLAARARRSLGVDGHLHLRHEGARAGARGRRRAVDRRTTSARTSSPR